ncbi:Uncharacterised protein [Mycobacteroides abscessus]|nr:Uncharacterised protein [Mycobacteroides abscessus]
MGCMPERIRGRVPVGLPGSCVVSGTGAGPMCVASMDIAPF